MPPIDSYLNAYGNGIRRYGLTGVCVVLFGGRASLKVDFGISNAQARLSVSLFLLPDDSDAELSIPSPEPRLPVGSYASCYDDNRLRL